MSNYSKATDFAAKDALASGNPSKVIVGTEIDDEFNAIATAVATKADSASPTLTGTVTAASITASGTITATGTINFNSATVSDLGTVTTADINGGTVDGVTINNSVIGGTTPAAGTFTTLSATTYSGLPSATTSTAGIVELATGAETNTGTSTTLAVTPDALDDWTGSAQITTVGNLTSGSIEGTAVKSTGEVGGVKFLREDGDGTCSWQGVPGGIDTLSGLNDTSFTGPASGDVLRYNGSNWVDSSLSEAGIAPVASPTFTGTATIPTGTITTANITTGNITSANIDGGTVDGATINSSSIGGTTPSSGAFTTLSATGTATLSGTTNLTGTFQIGGSAVTSNASELNILDGTTAVTADLDKLAGVTATAAELNYNDVTTLGVVQANKTVTAGASGINFSSFDMTNVDVNSGTIDGTTIGAASASSGAFTTLSASSTCNVSTASNLQVEGSALMTGFKRFWTGTQAAYDLLTPDANTIYFING